MLRTTWLTILLSLGKEAASNINVSQLFCSKYGLKKGRSRSTLCNDVCYSKNTNNLDVALSYWQTLQMIIAEKGGGGGFSTKFYMGRLRPEVQPLNPFTYHFLTEKVPFPVLSIDKWCLFQRTSFRTWHPFFCCYERTRGKSRNQNVFSSF